MLEKAEKLLIDNQDKNDNQQKNSLDYVSFLLGACHYNYRLYDLSLPYFLKAYDGYKNWGDIHYYIGICYLKKKDPEKDRAVEYFKKAAILGYKLPSEVQDLMN